MTRSAGTTQWEARAKVLRCWISVAAVVSVVLTIGLLVGLLVPVRATLRARDRIQLQTEAKLIHRDVHGYFVQSVQIASQTPSRTVIREELVAYLQGKRSLSSYIEFAEPKLADAVAASPEMSAVYRYDPSGAFLVGAGVGVVPTELPIRDAAGPRTLPCGPLLHVIVPIEQSGFGLAGFDLVALSMDAIRNRLERTASERPAMRLILFHGDGADIDIVIAAGASPSELDELETLPPVGEVIELDGRRFYSQVSTIRERWRLAVLMDLDHLYCNSDNSVRMIVVLVVVVGTLFGLTWAWMLRLVRERSAAEARELSEIVDSQTAQLRELLSQRELLMREAHHRIKNDMGIVRSFLQMHVEETQSREARRTISEADTKLATMQAVYDRLYRAPDVGSIEIRPLLGSLLSDLQETASGRKLVVAAEMEDSALDRTTATSISIAVAELVTNCIKYADAEDLHVDVRLVRRDGLLALSVTDNGSGFPPAVVAGEYGFGLSMVKTLADQAGGRLIVADKDPARVTIVMPVESR